MGEDTFEKPIIEKGHVTDRYNIGDADRNFDKFGIPTPPPSFAGSRRGVLKMSRQPNTKEIQERARQSQADGLVGSMQRKVKEVVITAEDRIKQNCLRF